MKWSERKNDQGNIASVLLVGQNLDGISHKLNLVLLSIHPLWQLYDGITTPSCNNNILKQGIVICAIKDWTKVTYGR